MLLASGGGIRDKWVRAVMNIQKNQEKEGTLSDFIGFIGEETDLVIDHQFPKGAIDQYQEKKFTENDYPKKRLSSYSGRSRE